MTDVRPERGPDQWLQVRINLSEYDPDIVEKGEAQIFACEALKRNMDLIPYDAMTQAVFEEPASYYVQPAKSKAELPRAPIRPRGVKRQQERPNANWRKRR